MNTMTLVKVLFTPTTGWPEAVNASSPPIGILLLLVVPSMLLPSVMLQHAGEHPFLLASLGDKQWVLNAPFLIFLEGITFGVFIFQIKNITNTYGANIGYREAFLLGAISIIPFCLSFLALSDPSPGFLFAWMLGALGYSIFIFYKGVCAFNAAGEEIHSTHIVYTVVGAAGSWVVLLAILIVLS